MEITRQIRGTRHWPFAQLSVRGLIVIVLVLGCGLGWIVQRARVQQRAVAAIKSAGGSVEYDRQFSSGRYNPKGRPRGPRWLRDRLGPDYFDTAVKVSLIQATDAELAQVGQLNRLEDLSVVGDRLTDSGLVHLQGLRNLKFLLLENRPSAQPGMKGACLTNLKGLTQLQTLLLYGVPVADADLLSLKDLSSLTCLFMPQSQVTDEGVLILRDLSNLQDLMIGPSTLTNTGLAALAGLTKLTRLEILASRIRDLVPIRHLTGMQILCIRDAPLDDAGLTPVASFRGLLFLDLEATRITDGGLSSVNGLTRLRDLNLSGTLVTDSGLANLSRLKSLNTLNLSNTQITDAGLERLAGLSGLRLLNVRGTRATDAGIAVLRKSLPLLKGVIR